MCGRLSILIVMLMALSAEAQKLNPGGMTLLRLLPQKERELKPDDLDIAVWPTALIDADRTHYLSQSTPTIMIFALANP